MKNLPEDIEPVSIARWTPKGIKIRSCSRLFPPQKLLAAYKNGEIDEDGYTKEYCRLLASLDVHAAASALDGKALVCFEGKEKFCHRHLAAKWFRENGYRCEEF